MTSNYKQALKDIRELILINGSYDEWLALQIMTVIGNCLPMTEMEVANTEWQRLTKQSRRKNQTTEQDDGSKKEVNKLRIQWQDADALSKVYQGLARDAMAKYMAAVDKETEGEVPPAKLWERMNIDGLTGDVTFLPEDKVAADENWNLQADIAPATVEDVFNYLADQETDDV